MENRVRAKGCLENRGRKEGDKNKLIHLPDLPPTLKYFKFELLESDLIRILTHQISLTNFQIQHHLPKLQEIESQIPTWLSQLNSSQIASYNQARKEILQAREQIQKWSTEKLVITL